ncbi:MAG: hypothetical protein J6R88_05950 [Clostridia bacterium]|nr:hypothetical protein [Clostridia bacterium]
MLNIFIGAGLIVVCSMLGKVKAQKLKNEYLFFSSLRSFCKSYETNLAYGKKDLTVFLNETYALTEFTEVLNNFILNSQIALPNYLNAKEVYDVTNFFNELGKSDSASQLITVKSYYNTFLDVEKVKNDEFKKHYSAYLKIGFSIGFMLFLVVI